MKFKKYDNCLFRHDDSGKVELCQDGKWIPYDEDDNFDVKMMGMPLDEGRAKKWESDMQQRGNQASA